MKNLLKSKCKHVCYSLFLAIGGSFVSQAQNAFPTQQMEKSVAIQQVAKKKKKQQTNKAVTVLWGAGGSYGSAHGEFSSGFSTGSLSATQWSAISLNESNGSVTPGSAYWTRSTTGVSQGAYWGSQTAIASSSRTNGVAIFDSDFLDNAGTAGAFGTGTSPGAHKGELISPSIDLTGYTDTSISLEFYCQWRKYQAQEFSVSISVDGGATWTTQSIENYIPSTGTVREGNVKIKFPQILFGVTNLSNCKIKFTFDGYYYYAMIDDLSIVTNEEFDLTITTVDENSTSAQGKQKDFQITDNAHIPVDQIRSQSLRFGGNVKNLGYKEITPFYNVKLNVDIQRNVSGTWTSVHQQNTSIDSLSALGNGRVFLDSINSVAWATVGSYRVLYYPSILNSFYAVEADRSNDTLVQYFELNGGDYYSKVSLTNNAPTVTRPIFPGGTDFNRFEFGSTFNVETDIQIDSISYQYHVPSGYVGTGSQVIRSYVYEWVDGAGNGTVDNLIDFNRTSGELTLVGSGVDSISMINSNIGNNVLSRIYLNDLSDTGKIKLDSSKVYFVSLSLEGTSFTSTNSVWLGVSQEKNYTVNVLDAVNRGKVSLSPSQLFIVDGTGISSGNWLGFGLDLVPSFGIHTSIPPNNDVSVTSFLNLNSSYCNTSALSYSVVIKNESANAETNVPYTISENSTGPIASGIISSLAGNSSDTIAVGPINVTTGTYAFSAYTSLSNDIDKSNDTLVKQVYVSNLSSTINTSSNVSCNGLTDGSVTVSAANGITPYTYLWSVGSTTASISGLAAGAYTVTVADASGCTVSNSDTIMEPSALAISISSASNVSCNSGNDGSVTGAATGGTAPYTYLWSNGATTATASNLIAGSYTVTVTDANGCTVTNSDTIMEPSALAISISSASNVSCNSGNDGSVTGAATGGTAPYTYLWSNAATTATASNLIAGSYTVTVTDANGCTVTNSDTIMEPSALVISISASSNVSCNGGSDGSATASANGGTTSYSYLWSTGATTASISSLTAGTYTITTTDANGCTATNTATITEPTALTTSISATNNVSCNGGSDGSATASANGGTTSYSYLWSTGATTASISSLAVGTYTITTTDANGCTATITATITEPTALTTSISATNNVTCNGGSDGSATATANGGTTSYSYLWSTGATTASVSSLTAGTYTITTTDANGCTATNTATITEPTALTTSISATNNVTCNGGSDGSATATANGGTTSYSYLWSTGATTASVSSLTAGTYTITTTDANGCTATNTATITEPTVLTTSISGTNNVTCNGGSDGSATGTATGGIAPYTYLWSNAGTTAVASNLIAGSYSVTITDANGCTATSSVTVTEPAAIITTVSRNGFALSSDQTGASYQWLDCNNSNVAISGETGQTLNVTANGSYAVEVTLNGCTDTSNCISVLNVGIENNRVEEASFAIYPNPSKGIFMIDLGELFTSKEVLEIYNISGSLISTVSVSSASQRLDISELANGVYFVRYRSQMKKIIISK